jgi:hypothetical protein
VALPQEALRPPTNRNHDKTFAIDALRDDVLNEAGLPSLAPRISHTGWGFEERPRQLHADIVAMKVRNLRESWRTQWWCCDWRCRI